MTCLPHMRSGLAALGLATLLPVLTGCGALGSSSKPETTMHARMNESFLAKAPLVGDPLPDAQGFDENGQPFALSETRGRITVLVAGCMT